ncbi:SGNH/GDSL hydrolase family protein [Kitasatospora azatica]|uniref:SGNH/GDSL hydrolase family protein n=1 Tax=Kitasatospora azatica TaxID=58347 RepID=UPI00068B4D13|nr:SGNH/GDSL hydrolase family protein [Kitasatospora azatica]
MLRNPLWDGSGVPDPQGLRGPTHGEPLRLAVLGDSSAVTVGVTRVEQTVAAVLADALAAGLDCPVEVQVEARAGATTASMSRQIRTVAAQEPGVAIVQIGGNDVFLPVSLRRTAARLAGHVERLRAGGWQVVVTSCPDVSAARAVRRWARPLGRRRSKRLASLQTAAALRAGAAVVSLTAPEFRSHPRALYCPDGFHPSPDGYRLYQNRALPAILTAGHAHRYRTSSSPCPSGPPSEPGYLGDHAYDLSVPEAMREIHRRPGASFFPRTSPTGELSVRCVPWQSASRPAAPPVHNPAAQAAVR